ncbi:hypothetical protein MLD38_007807 [Melastoma candidum]|uniref:Uncharacterized protein n=1 Tax=Melastoma candidum TaxID=119954 RepID=A0ACB9RRZ2_9MYRT|nr:hypothetical protein MLD38_007807 [Melastoma candidum]
METPCSMRRVTRSQTAAAAAAASASPTSSNPSLNLEEAGSKVRQGGGKQQQEVRSALLDITNDSPIVGLAVGSLKTPLSSVARKRGDAARVKSTPGSGEALLRSQVKNLLQKVEEEAEISKIPMEGRVQFFRLQGLVNGSPSASFAPTPANTPQVSDGLSMSDPIVSKEQLISKVLNDIFEGKEEEEDGVGESQIGLVTRSLLLDFSEKSVTSHDASDGLSGLTFQGGYSSGESKEKLAMTDDDNSSIQSIQVNAIITDDAEEEIEEEDEQEDYYDNNMEQQQLDCSFVDELCNGIENMFVNKEKVVARFGGKHTRFVYDSDNDKIVAEEEEKGMATPPGGVVRLNGMPTPRGKHTRFPEEEEVDE